MGDPRQNAYGKAGGGANQGQGLTRFEIGGDPSEYFPIQVSGSMKSTTPAFLMEAAGAAYRYGTLKVGGLTNLIPNGAVGYPVMDASLGAINQLSLLLGGITGDGSGTGGNNFDAIQNTIYGVPYTTVTAGLNDAFVNGEMAASLTTTGAAGYGALKEALTLNVAGTVAGPTGTNTFTGVGTTFLTAQFTLAAPPYNAYAPSGNLLRVGDVIEAITGGASYFYRILTIPDNLHVTVFPNITVNIPAGSAYTLWRTGFPSSSRIVTIPDTTTGDVWAYYAGNGGMDGTGANVPTLQAVRVGGAFTHRMAPRTSAPLDIKATDCIYYKGFLLYGFAGGIGWSVGPFPGAFPFGPTDFPALNASVFNNTGVFCHFEQIGEQVIALFDDSLWLVQATGSVPEFAFYRLPDIIGVTASQLSDPQAPSYTQARASCSGHNAVYFLSANGMQRLSGLQSAPVSVPMDSYDLPAAGAIATTSSKALSYDAAMECVVMTDNAGNTALCYKALDDSWFRLDFSGHTNGARIIAGGFNKGGQPRANFFRRPGFAYYDRSRFTINQGFAVGTPPAGGNIGGLEIDTLAVSATPWIWATPIVSLGSIQGLFTFGGIAIEARASLNAVAPVTLTWTVYEGSSPYKMSVWDTGLFDYSVGTTSSASLLGKKCPSPYVGFVLTGTSWIELAAIWIFSANRKSRK